MSKKDLILIGGGGHAKACIDVIELEGSFKIAGIVDLPEKLHQEVLGYEIIATDDDLPRLAQDYNYFFIAIGQIRSPAIRIKLFDMLNGLEVNLPSIVSPQAYVSSHACIGNGTIVMHQALINAGAVIADNCIINTKALIEHDSKINDHCHIATGAIINGCAEVGTGSFVGSGTVCNQAVKIGKNVVAGSGLRITEHLPDNMILR